MKVKHTDCSWIMWNWIDLNHTINPSKTLITSDNLHDCSIEGCCVFKEDIFVPLMEWTQEMPCVLKMDVINALDEYKLQVKIFIHIIFVWFYKTAISVQP